MLTGNESSPRHPLGVSHLDIPAWSRLPRAPLAAAGAALAVEMITNLVNYGLDDRRFRLLDSSYQWSYSHLLATIAFVTGAGFCTLGALTDGERRIAWSVAGGLFGLLAIDNVTRLHEHIGSWPLIFAPLLLCLSACIVAIARGTDLAALVYLGLAVLFSSLVIHVLGPHAVRALGWGSDTWAYQVKVGLKEGTELAGWVLLVPTLGRLAWRRRKRRVGGMANTVLTRTARGS